jgi:hypothetical protein
LALVRERPVCRTCRTCPHGSVVSDDEACVYCALALFTRATFAGPVMDLVGYLAVGRMWGLGAIDLTYWEWADEVAAYELGREQELPLPYLPFPFPLMHMLRREDIYPSSR